jgi:hypothetical protein
MTFLSGLAGTNRRYGGLALAGENSYIYRTRSGQIQLQVMDAEDRPR